MPSMSARLHRLLGVACMELHVVRVQERPIVMNPLVISTRDIHFALAHDYRGTNLVVCLRTRDHDNP